jgi:hypothetical protein
MNKLLKKIAALETKLDFYETELKNLNTLLKNCGFSEGIKTMKESALELLQTEESYKIVE